METMSEEHMVVVLYVQADMINLIYFIYKLDMHKFIFNTGSSTRTTNHR